MFASILSRLASVDTLGSRLAGLAKRFSGDQRGNMTVLAGMMALPLFAVSGAAIDFSRAVGVRAELANALDTGILALGRRPKMTDTDAQAFLNDYMNDLMATNGKDFNWSITSLTQGTRTIEATVSSSVDTVMLSVMNMHEIVVDVTAQITRENKKVEVALVLDNTGSMRWSGKIEALRDATETLLDVLYEHPDSEEKVKVSLVPFVTSVNIKTDGYTKQWIDRKGKSEHNGENFDAATGPTHHWKLFKEMNGVSWKGCVEARPEPYDLSDDPPVKSSPDTLWVPYLWPDEPDTSGSYANDYLPDGVSGSNEVRQLNAAKYIDSNPYIDESPSTTYGPNKSCPQPILPLTNDVDRLQDEAAEMTPWSSSGTNIALGLSWGWRVLSPGEPFTGGVAYDDDEVQKAIVLLTDGRNEIVSRSTHNHSDYTGYGYLEMERLGTSSVSQAVDKVNDKVAELCERVKEKGIRIYTITFQLNDNALKDVFRDCATYPNLYYDSPTNQQLAENFEAIALDLSDLRLSK